MAPHATMGADAVTEWSVPRSATAMAFSVQDQRRGSLTAVVSARTTSRLWTVVATNFSTASLRRNQP